MQFNMLRKNIYELTWNSKKPIIHKLTNCEYLIRGIVNLRATFKDTVYEQMLISWQQNELFLQNKELWRFEYE